MHYVYFARSKSNKKVYVGSTGKDPNIRIKEHNSGSNQWSEQNKPLELIYYESYACKTDAIRREKFYKSGFGKQIKKSIIEALNNK